MKRGVPILFLFCALTLCAVYLAQREPGDRPENPGDPRSRALSSSAPQSPDGEGLPGSTSSRPFSSEDDPDADTHAAGPDTGPRPVSQHDAPHLIGSVAYKRDGLPVTGAEVTALRDGGTEERARTDTEGKFRFADLPEGSYTLTARTETHLTAPDDLQRATVEAGTNAETGTIYLVEGAVLEVRVVDMARDLPVPDVRVDFRATGHAGEVPPVSGITDLTGMVQFRGLSAGKGKVQAARDGYVTLPAGTDADAELTLGGRSSKRISMCRVYRLGGRIEDIEGNPVGSARVEISTGDSLTRPGGAVRPPLETETAPDGRFPLGQLLSPLVHIRVTAKGFSEFVMPDVRLPNEDLRIVLRRGGSGVVAGIVIDYETGAPVRSFRANLTRAGSNEEIDGQEVSRGLGEGTFRFTGVTPGEYRVSSRSQGYLPSSSRPFAVDAEGNSNWVVVRMAKGASVEGMVVSGTDTAVEGARVEYRGPALDFLADASGMNLATTTGPDGRFRLDLIPSGSFTLSANHPHHAQTETEVLEVSPGKTLRGVRIVMEDSGRVEGHVLNPGGSPAAGETILVQRHDTGQVVNLWAETDGDGFYSRDQLPPGVYFIQIKSGSSGVHPLASKRIELEAGAKRVVDFGVDGVRLHGRVTRGGQPVSGELVLLTQPQSQMFFCATTEGNGSYEFRFLHPGHFWYSVQEPFGWRKYGKGEVSVPAGVREFEFPIELTEGSISGIVVEPGGRWLIPNAVVSVRPKDTKVDLTSWIRPDETCRTGAEGEFAAEGLELGEYSVTATAEGFGQVTKDITLTPEAYQVHIVMETKKAGSLTVSALDARTMTPISASLLLTDLYGASVIRSDSFRRVSRNGGTYTIDLAPGGYYLFVSVDGYIGEVRQLEINEGEEARITVSLERGSPVRITVQDSEGRAMIPERVDLHDSAGAVNEVFHYGVYEWFDCYLHPGPARVEVHQAGYKTTVKDFEVPEVGAESGLQQPTGVMVVLEPVLVGVDDLVGY